MKKNLFIINNIRSILYYLYYLLSIIHNPQSTINNYGYVLYLVLVVLTAAGVLFTVSLRSSGAAYIFSVRHLQNIQAKLLAQSGIARTEFFLNGGDGHDLNWETSHFEEKLDNFGVINLSCKTFGIFSRIKSTGIRFKKSHTIECLMGRDIPENLKPVITLTGHVGGLVLADGTQIKGKVVLHHGNVTRGKNRSPIRNSGKWVECKESPAIPFDIKKIEDFLESSALKISSANSLKNAITGNVFLSSSNDTILKRKPLTIVGDCEIKDVNIENTSIIATGIVTLNIGAVCKGSMFLCEQLAIKGGKTSGCLFFSNSIQNIVGGTHSSQFISNDSIVIDRAAEFNNTSLLISHRIQNSDTTLTGGIIFPKNKVFYGHAICFTDSIENKSKVRSGPSIVLGEGSAVNGCLITDSDISMKSVSINGHIWARSIVTVDDKISYKNWLLGCKIKPLDSYLPFPLLGDVPAKVSLVEGY